LKKDNSDIKPEKIPAHVAIIMDGNGRWAQKRLMPRALGHKAGVERVRTVVRMSSDLGISALTLYAFSTENWKRPKDEVSILMSLLIEYLEKEIDELCEKNVQIRTIGDSSRLPESVQTAVNGAIARTKNNTGLKLIMALNYGSRTEIVSAAKKIAEDVASGKIVPDAIDEALFSDYLYMNDIPEPDLMIRTSGEKRISNFLLYQIAYSELYFTDVFWPDFDEMQYMNALREYERRQRRFGAI